MRAYIYCISACFIILIPLGAFNVSNKLLVSIDILFEMREHIKKGEPPGNTANAVLTAALLQPSAPIMMENEVRYLMEKL